MLDKTTLPDAEAMQGAFAPSIIQKKRTKAHRSVNWGAYREQREEFAAAYPMAILPSGTSWKKPLAHGTLEELIGRGWSPAVVDNFLKGYTYGPKYQAALAAGGRRYDLDGKPRGKITPNEIAYAHRCLCNHYSQFPKKA